MTMPTWLQRHLVSTGMLDEEGRGRAAHPRHCPHCGLVVLIGYDADLCARLVTVDPIPLNALGEAVALMAGRYTRTLWRLAGRRELCSRRPGQIRHRPAGHPHARFDVLAEHRCGWPLPPLAQRAPSVHDRVYANSLPPGSPAPF